MPPVRPRGMGPVSPRDFTGKQFALNQKAQIDAETRDIDSEIKAAHKKGFDQGWDEAIKFVMKSYDVYEREDEDDEIGIEVGH